MADVLADRSCAHVRTPAAAVDEQQVVERAEDLLSNLQKLADEKENDAFPEMDEEGFIKKEGCEDHESKVLKGVRTTGVVVTKHDPAGAFLDAFKLHYLRFSEARRETSGVHLTMTTVTAKDHIVSAIMLTAFLVPEITRDSEGLWDCPGGFSGDDSVAENNEEDGDTSMMEESILQILQEDPSDPEAADDTEIPAVADGEALDIRGLDDDVLVTKGGCEGHKRGEQWGSSDHDNCICGESDRLCYPVVCLPGSQIKPDSNRLWTCEVNSRKRDIAESAHEVIESEKREPLTAGAVATVATGAFGVFTGVVGLVGFAMDRYESAQTTKQLNEIQAQIRKLDKKIDDLTRSVSDLQLGQQYLQQVILYGRDELRLRNVLDTLASIEASDGQYVGSDLQGWADSVLSHGSDGIRNVLFNLLDMVQPHSSLFGGKSLFEIYRQQRNTNAGDLEQDMVKMRLKVAQVYGLIGGGYCAWATALRIKGRQGDIPAVVQEGKTKLNDVEQSLQPYFDYGTCDDGYQRKNRKCYKAFGINKNWADASAYCQSQGAGGNLAMPKDSSTNEFLIQLKMI
ncbi:hypothetical protein Bbelb_241120 [Branchiostoma belcheri]|nr:hypothetical protein Bbelb_241120 [Branchiostoma belcheri]